MLNISLKYKNINSKLLINNKYKVFDSVDINALSRLYFSIDDVDLFVLGLGERPQRGALIGPTFSCIIGKQFQRVISFIC